MEKFKSLVAVHLFLIKDGKILLLRRFNTTYEDGNYSVPAGHLDGGESVTAAMVREAKEETGLVIELSDLKVVNVMHRYFGDLEYVNFFLTAIKWQGEPTITEPDKCDDLSWFELNNLPENVIPYIKYAIESHAKGEFFTEYGWNNKNNIAR